jgi:hypothetical protein
MTSLSRCSYPTAVKVRSRSAWLALSRSRSPAAGSTAGVIPRRPLQQDHGDVVGVRRPAGAELRVGHVGAGEQPGQGGGVLVVGGREGHPDLRDPFGLQKRRAVRRGEEHPLADQGARAEDVGPWAVRISVGQQRPHVWVPVAVRLAEGDGPAHPAVTSRLARATSRTVTPFLWRPPRPRPDRPPRRAQPDEPALHADVVGVRLTLAVARRRGHASASGASASAAASAAGGRHGRSKRNTRNASP